MPLFAKDFQTLMRDSIDEIVSSTSITQMSPGSKMRSLLEAINRQVEGLYNTFDTHFARAFISGASGRYLDFMGELLGIPRSGAINASISSGQGLVKFYVTSGTFGNINSELPITVPQGTLIKTSTSVGAVAYKTLLTNVLAADQSTLYISVESLTTGNDANVATDTLTTHTFEDYTDFQNETLKVTNVGAITQARNIESDTNYRFRLSNGVLDLAKANQTSIRLAALRVPGVSDVVFLPRHRGIGTFDMILQSVTPTVSSSLITSVETAVSSNVAEGITFEIRSPQEFGITVEVSITLRNTVSVKETANIQALVDSSIIEYVNSLGIGDELTFNRFIDIVLSLDDRIKNVGTSSKPIDNITLYSPTNLDDNKIRSELLDDFVPPTDGRIIIETSVSDPVIVRVR